MLTVLQCILLASDFSDVIDFELKRLDVSMVYISHVYIIEYTCDRATILGTEYKCDNWPLDMFLSLEN